jgi:hypothetical protein
MPERGRVTGRNDGSLAAGFDRIVARGIPTGRTTGTAKNAKRASTARRSAKKAFYFRRAVWPAVGIVLTSTPFRRLCAARLKDASSSAGGQRSRDMHQRERQMDDPRRGSAGLVGARHRQSLAALQNVSGARLRGRAQSVETLSANERRSS